MSEQGGTFMQMIGGVASEKCSSCQLVDLKMNEVWFGVHRLKSGVSQTKTPAGSDLPVRSWVKIPIFFVDVTFNVDLCQFDVKCYFLKRVYLVVRVVD